jgi:GxxExxY protein
MTETELNTLTQSIIGAAIEVHRELGPGLLEKIYQRCLKIALEEIGHSAEMECPLPVIFRGRKIDDDGYRLDLLVDNIIILEIKSVVSLAPIHEKQLLSYLRLAKKPCGLVLNFNTARLADGISRVKNGYLAIPPSETIQ